MPNWVFPAAQRSTGIYNAAAKRYIIGPAHAYARFIIIGEGYILNIINTTDSSFIIELAEGAATAATTCRRHRYTYYPLLAPPIFKLKFELPAAFGLPTAIKVITWFPVIRKLPAPAKVKPFTRDAE